MAGKGPQDWISQAKAWEGLGATHLSVGTAGGVRRSPQEHIDALQQFKKVADSGGLDVHQG
jgi:hypothetical protein